MPPPPQAAVSGAKQFLETLRRAMSPVQPSQNKGARTMALAQPLIESDVNLTTLQNTSLILALPPRNHPFSELRESTPAMGG